MDAIEAARRALWHPAERRPATGVRLALGAAVIVAGIAVSSLLGGALAGRVGVTSVAVPAVAVGIGSIAAIAGLARVVDRRPVADYGLGLDRGWMVDLGVGLALGAVLQTGILAVGVAGGWLTVGAVAAPGSVLVDLAKLAALFVAVGVWEEVAIRGWLLTNLAEGLRLAGERVAVAAAVGLSAAVFGLGHANNPEASVVSTGLIVCAGVFLGVGYVVTGELGVPIGVHITWNFFQGPVYGLGVSGFGVETSLVATESTGPTWVTGGAFGPEAGLLGLGALLTGTLLVAGWARRCHGRFGVHPSITTPTLRSGAAPDSTEPPTAGDEGPA